MTNTIKSADMILAESTLKRLGLLESQLADVKQVVGLLSSDQAVFKYQSVQAQRVSEKLETIVDRIVERGETDLVKTISMVDASESKLESAILAHKEAVLRDVALQHQSLVQQFQGLATKIDKLQEDHQAMQKWMWILMGTLATLSVVGEKVLPSLLG